MPEHGAIEDAALDILSVYCASCDDWLRLECRTIYGLLEAFNLHYIKAHRSEAQ